MNLQIQRLWGYAPLQAFGTIYAFPWYFRARGDRWQFAVALLREAVEADAILISAGQKSGFLIARRYGRPGSNDASAMTEAVAISFITESARLFLDTLYQQKAG